MSLKGKWDDLGRVLRHACPHCHDTTFFHLMEGKTKKSFLFFSSTDVRLVLRCEACKYFVDVDPEDETKARTLHAKAAAFQQREISGEDLHAHTQQCGLKALEILAQEAETGECPACEASVPATFEVCWNCGGPLEATVQIDPPDTPNSIGTEDVIFGAQPFIQHENAPLEK